VAAGELFLDRWAVDRDPAVNALVVDQSRRPGEGLPQGGAGERPLGALAELIELVAGVGA